jgi:hypothetical protein
MRGPTTPDAPASVTGTVRAAVLLRRERSMATLYEVTSCERAGGTVRTSLYPSSGHVPPGSRARLVDSVMDLPEVRASARLEATGPLGDAEALQRLRERTRDAVTRPVGSTALVDADIRA